MDNDRMKKWYHMVKADIRLKDIPIKELEEVPENIEDVCLVSNLLEIQRGEGEKAFSDDEIMRRAQNIIFNLGIEALRRKFAVSHAKLAKHGEKLLSGIDIHLKFPDRRAFVTSFAMMIREKTGIEMGPELAAKVFLEALEREKQSRDNVEKPEE